MSEISWFEAWSETKPPDGATLTLDDVRQGIIQLHIGHGPDDEVYCIICGIAWPKGESFSEHFNKVHSNQF